MWVAPQVADEPDRPRRGGVHDGEPGSMLARVVQGARRVPGVHAGHGVRAHTGGVELRHVARREDENVAHVRASPSQEHPPAL